MKNFNRLMTIGFALFLGIPNQIFADNWLSGGNYSITWFSNTQSEFTITTNKELAGVAYLVNNGYTTFKNITIKLGDDISLTGKDWKTIGQDDSHSFQGTFDGQGHTISGITIVRESGDQNYFGFWGNLINATIKNTHFIGEVNVTEPTSYYLKQFTAGIAAFANNCNFEKCVCEMPVTYYRKDTNSFGPTSSKNRYLVRVGGIIGEAYKSSVQYCRHSGNVSCTFGSSAQNGEYYSDEQINYVGGIVGNAEYTDIMYCENNSTQISNEASGTKNDARFYMCLGGIAGNAYRGSIISCTSISDFYAMFKGSLTMYMSIGGIVGAATITHYSWESSTNSVNIYNCYSPSTWIYAGAGSSSTTVYYGSIVGQNSENGTVSTADANFGASDLSINQTTLHKVKGYSGASSYSSAGMKTDTFLEELNVYPYLKLGKAIWNRNTGYPYITELYETTSITPVKSDYIKHQNSIYSISGIRLAVPKKGINIINGKKVYKK